MAAAPPCPALARDDIQSKTTYDVLISGVSSGAMTVEGGQQRRRIAYQFNDRGRGPDIVSWTQLGPDLSLHGIRTTGVDYYKRPVDERFDRAEGRAVWSAANDRGEVASQAFYLPAESTPEHLAILARALLRAGGRLDVLPGGQATIEALGELELSASGRPLKAKLYAVSGLGFEARPLWLDEDGQLLASGVVWSATVRTDLVDQAAHLLGEQRRLLDARDEARAAKLGGQARPLALRNVAVFDAEAKARRLGWSVVVRDGVIIAAGADGEVQIPADAQVIEGRGRTLLPGLWDMHVHVSSNAQGLLHLASGVTSVRDLANDAEELAQRRAAFDSGKLIGPRIIPAGFIDGPGPLAGPIKVLADTPQQLRAAIQDYAKRGYGQIKLYSSLDPALVPVAADEARKLGMRLSGHVPAGMTMSQAVEAGFDEVHHFNFAALNFMGPEINARSNGIGRITAVAEHAWQIDPNSAQVQAFLAQLKSKGVTVDPTFSLYENHLLGRPGRPSPSLSRIVDRLPPLVRRGAFGAGLAANDEEAQRNGRSYVAMQRLLKAFHAAGVTLVPGTDAMAGFSYHRELELYVEAGIPAADVLHMATLGAARVARLDERSGLIAAGKRADLVLIDGDPLSRICDIRNVDLVIANGRAFDPERLLGELGVAPDHRRSQAQPKSRPT